ncbi:MAG: 16S rRNA (adenine1518-N6/adenine1519-N6)-dimethyltransferase [Sphingobacteriales bacterium]|jgi:16S rRNA (adenine1518-N6/adenine1519-N6)-dimethyltransferase
MTRKKETMITSDYKLFKTVVKLAFGQRRKTMRNSLKSMLPEGFTSDILSQRPEQLSIAEFDALICAMEQHPK